MKPNIVAVGIDSLNVGFNINQWRVDDTAFKRLADAKINAGLSLFGGKGETVKWGDREFNLLAKGTKGYEYVMNNDDVRLYIAKNCMGGRIYPEVFAQLNSCYLWGKGYQTAFNQFKSWLGEWAEVGGEKINRADLCTDLDISLPKLDLANEIVTRARKKVDYFQVEKYTNGRRDTGYRIGAKDLMARIYDKAYEIKGSEKYWFQDIWERGGWNGKSGITRIEFQTRRPYLKEFSVNSFEELIIVLPDMWRVITGEWMELKEPNKEDSNHRRWKTSEMWETVQAAGGRFGECLGIQRWKQKQPRIDPIMAQMKGLITSEIALDSTIRGQFHATSRLKSLLNEYLESSEFIFEVNKKRGKYASM